MQPEIPLPSRDPLRPRTARAALLALAVLFPALTLLWLLLHRAPPNWDDAWYLANSLQMFDSLVDHGLLGYAKGFFSALGFKAPLITVLPTPFYLIFGRHWHAAFGVNLASMVVLFAALYWTANKLANSRVGLIAVYIVATMPLLYGLSRWYMVEYALTACVAVAIAFLLASDNFDEPLAAACCGVTIGFGLLLKASFPVFVAAPLAYSLVQSRRRGRALLLLALPAGIIALPWYALHFVATLANALAAAYGESAIVQGTGPVFALSSIGAYLRLLAVNGVSEYYVALAVISGVLCFARRQKTAKGGQGWRLVLLWLSPILLFLFVGNKDIRYAAPLLPAFALGLAMGMERALESVEPFRWSIRVLCLTLVYPLFSMLSVSFAVPIRGHDAGYAYRYSRREWPQGSVLMQIARLAPVRPGERIRLVMGSDRGYFNADNFALAAMGARLPFEVTTVAYKRELVEVLRAVDAASFVVYKEGGEPESPFFGRFYTDLVDHVHRDPRFTEIPFDGDMLPDGGRVRIFRNDGGRALPHASALLP
jgi:hypothetical protein